MSREERRGGERSRVMMAGIRDVCEEHEFLDKNEEEEQEWEV